MKNATCWVPPCSYDVYRAWIPEKYTVTVNPAMPQITYYNEDGTVYCKQCYEAIGDPITLPNPPVKRGWSFTGWSPTLPATLQQLRYEVTATFQINTYTIYWSDDAGDHQDNFYYGDPINLTPQPRTGHTATFDPELPATMPDEDITTTVVYTRNQYTVYWSDDAGSHETKFYYDYPVSITPQARTGYSTSFSPALPATMPDHDITTTVVYTVNQYNINWSDDAGSHVTVYDYGTTINLPVQPRTGHSYHFEPDIPATMPAYDITTTVIYTLNQYTIYWTDYEGAHETQFYYDYPVSLTPYEREGFTLHFDPALPERMPDHDITTTVVYVGLPYTVYWSDDAGDHETVVLCGDPIVLPVQPRLGYSYRFEPELPAEMPPHDVTTTVVYFLKLITLTFLVDGQVYDTKQGYFGDDVTRPENPPEKEGKEFAGWSPRCPQVFPPNDASFTALYLDYVHKSDDLPVFREKLLNASTGEVRPGNIIEPVLSDPVYDVAHGCYVQVVSVGGADTGYRIYTESPTEEDVDISLPLFHDGKYYHINWLSERNSAGQIMTLGEQVPYSSFYAEITGVNLIGADYYEEILTADGTYTGNRVDLISRVYTQSLEDASDWTLNWTFTGILQHIEEDVDVRELPFHEISISKTGVITERTITPDSSSWLYPYSYVPATYTESEFALFTSDFRAELLADKTDATHYIKSVTVSLSTGYEWTIVEKATDDVTVNVRIFDGQSLYSVLAGIPGTPFEYETPVKAGYTFDRLDPNLQVYPNTDTDVQAIFTEIPVPEPEPEKVHTLTAMVEGAVYATAKVEELTSTAGLIADPIVPGKRFTGWSPAIPATMPKNDLTVTAQFTASGGTFTLTYQVDSSTYKTYQVKAGASVPVQPYPTKALYEFSGWTGVPEVMPAENVTVTGTFTNKRTEVYPGEAKRRTITYKINHMESDAQGATSVYRVAYHVAGDAITKLALPVKANYSFSAWSGFPATNVMPDDDVVVTTTQTDAKQLARFYVDDSLQDTTQNVVGEKITLPSTPVKAGYTFRYWANCPTYQPAETVTATAVFEPNDA